MIGALLFVAAALWSDDKYRETPPPTAQELGYPVGCVALYGGTGGIHLIKVNCPGPDPSDLDPEMLEDYARKIFGANINDDIKKRKNGDDAPRSKKSPRASSKQAVSP